MDKRGARNWQKVSERPKRTGVEKKSKKIRDDASKRIGDKDKKRKQ